MSVTTTRAFAPVADGERARVLDALRGFALLGIFISHVPDVSGYSFLAAGARARLDALGIDGPLAAVFRFLITNKFYSLFSLLFGIGFAVQLESAARRSAAFAPHFARRLAVLLAIGLAHASLWYGDILKDYALIGFVLIVTARWTTAQVARAAAIVLIARVAWPVLMAGLVSGLAAAPSGGDPQGSFDALTHAFGGSDIGAAFAANLQLLRLKAVQMIYDGKTVSVLGMFLLGALIGRMRLYRDLGAHEGLFRKVLWLCAPVGVIGNALLVRMHAATPEFPPTLAWIAEQGLAAIAVPAMTLSYAAGFALLWSRGGGRALRALAPVGQMALTTYVSQTLIGIGLFYGIGLGLGGRLGLAGGTAVGIAIFASQMLLSALWLRGFRFGPLEWLWRRATYGEPIAFRRAAAAPAVAEPVAERPGA
jgi:uncharacterized protein